MLEIERKFLLRHPPADLESYPGREIAQGYLVPSGEIEVRLRASRGKRTLTVKKHAGQQQPGLHTREEINVPLTEEQWAQLWPMTAGRRLAKHRYELPCGPYTVEVDVYGGKNAGLVVAEVEFPSAAEASVFVPPPWLGEEVTGHHAYSNPLLAIE